MSNRNNKYYQTLLLTLTLLIVLLTAYSLPLNATIRFVSKTGSSEPPFLTWETAADSIQECINISVFGDTIYVANGVYQEQVVMIPGLSLIGSGTDSTIINTQSLANSQGFVAVEVQDSCILTGFHIIVYYNNDRGYGIAQVGNSTVKNNKITSAARGIYCGWTGISTPIIYKNYVYNIQRGIHIYNSSPLVRENNIFPTENNAAPSIYGIWIQADNSNYRPIIDSNYIEAGLRCVAIEKSVGTRTTITNNEIIMKGGSDGIFLHNYVSDSNWVFNNIIYAESSAEGIYSNGVIHLQLYNNYVTGNIGDAITIRPSNVVKNNIVTKVNKGIIFSGSGNIVFQYNNIWDNNINYTAFSPDVLIFRLTRWW
jgi:hypothetical protein